ncbi:group 1 truncated hemoglobin [uncultured Roseobacter sp.]|uniref:group I truncated hemoglobin n=1 Tax=uncultured Roseobacter sp. TaxID=114847 RepID=UPI002602B2B7|nr:group 1 truncated hemoglobin [uncultured Roseobacter sp.]
MAERTLYEEYGGFSKVSKIVLSFYDSLLDNDEVGPFFDDVEMSRIVDHQTKFIASILGGPASYTDNQLRQLHSHLTITDGHFDELETVLRGTLLQHGMASEDVDLVVAEFEKRRPLIVR